MATSIALPPNIVLNGWSETTCTLVSWRQSYQCMRRYALSLLNHTDPLGPR